MFPLTHSDRGNRPPDDCFIADSRILITSAILILCSGCSVPYYVEPQDGPTASASFSNLSAEIPQIEIIRDCHASPINPDYIEQKKPTDLARKHMEIPAGKPVGFRYTYYWLTRDKTEVITHESRMRSNIEMKRSKEGYHCRRSIRFTPEAGRYYEIYFGISAGECRIGASEAYYTKGSVRKKLAPVKMLPNDTCR